MQFQNNFHAIFIVLQSNFISNYVGYPFNILDSTTVFVV